jgi:hypothetical protein
MQHGPLGIPSPTLTSPVVAAFLNTAMTDVLAITEMPKDANFFGEVVSGKQQVTRFQFALRPGQHRDQYAVPCAHHLADAARLRGALQDGGCIRRVRPTLESNSHRLGPAVQWGAGQLSSESGIHECATGGSHSCGAIAPTSFRTERFEVFHGCFP